MTPADFQPIQASFADYLRSAAQTGLPYCLYLALFAFGWRLVFSIVRKSFEPPDRVVLRRVKSAEEIQKEWVDLEAYEKREAERQAAQQEVEEAKREIASWLIDPEGAGLVAVVAPETGETQPGSVIHRL